MSRLLKVGLYQAYWGRVGGGQRYLGVVADLLSRHYHVDIIHHCPDFEARHVNEPMGLDLSRVSFRYLPRIDRVPSKVVNPIQRLREERNLGHEISEGYHLFIDSSDNVPFFCHARNGVLLVHFPLVSFETFHGCALDEASRFRFFKLLASVFHSLEWKLRFSSYQLCIVNSLYTKSWLKKLWGLDSTVVYPPLRNSIEPALKEPMILSVGSFHCAGHKKHEVMLHAFRDLCDAGLVGWRYVLVGASGMGEDDRKYVNNLRELVADYPVEIQINATGLELTSLLKKASVVWHSMGFGIDPAKEPGKLEHFGMVATEAMAAGCVPIVFHGGGLPESVSQGETGYLWRTVAELKEQTMAVIQNDQLRERISIAAVHRAKMFSLPQFEQNIMRALRPLLCCRT